MSLFHISYLSKDPEILNLAHQSLHTYIVLPAYTYIVPNFVFKTHPLSCSATGKQSIKRLLLLLGIVSSFLLMVSCVLFSSWLVLGDAQTREKKMCHTFCSDGFQIPKRLILLPPFTITISPMCKEREKNNKVNTDRIDVSSLLHYSLLRLDYSRSPKRLFLVQMNICRKQR